jgi:hypothetical protein
MIMGLYLSDNDQIVALTLQEPFFSVIDVKTKSLQTSFGRKGRANGELLNAPFGVNYRGGELQFFSFSTKSMVSILFIFVIIRPIYIKFYLDRTNI